MRPIPGISTRMSNKIENEYKRKELLTTVSSFIFEVINKDIKPKISHKICFFKKKYGSPIVFSASKSDDEEIKRRPINDNSEEYVSMGDTFID